MFGLYAGAEWEKLFDPVFRGEQKDTHQREGDIKEDSSAESYCGHDDKFRAWL